MKKISFNQNWEFQKEGDAQWTQVNLPHDAMLMDTRIPAMEKGSCSGYFPGGKYYYVKRFIGDPTWIEDSILVEFEGIYHHSTVWLNGEKVGGWIYGYTNFFVDISGKVRIDQENTLLVEADNSKVPNSRWYSGSGIYRPVNLWLGGKICISPQGLRVKTLSIDPAVIQVSVDTPENIEVCYEIYDGTIKVACGEGKTAQITISEPKLWSAEKPNLYIARAILISGDTILDAAETTFGIRNLSWDAEHGFQVNGKTEKLRGGCIHHDNGILGACTYKKAEERRIRKLKEFGFNAIRFSHNPAGKDLLDVCDRIGMYVLDESFDQWRIPNTAYDYSTCFDAEWRKDLTALVSKDYNHPCVVMYCIGNEITDTGRSYGPGLAKEMYETIKVIDDSRPVTIANNIFLSVMGSFMEQKELEQGKAVGSIEVNDLLGDIPALKATLTPEKIEKLVGGSFDAVDIAGFNYGTDMYAANRSLQPKRVILSSETMPSKMAANWRIVEENAWCIGDFQWSAWDYLGEAGVGLPVYGVDKAPFDKPYPCLSAACGSFDLTGMPEVAAYLAAILWEKYDKPYIAVRPVNHSGEVYTLGSWRLTDAINCWTWPGSEGKAAQITVYSVGEEVELWQDGILVARKVLKDAKAEFETAYRPGKLVAVSFAADGNKRAESALETVGSVTLLDIAPEETIIKADADEILYVPIHLKDAEGRLKMTEDLEITVAVEGQARLIALGSGRPDPVLLFDSTTCLSWHGSVLAVLRSTGSKGAICITVSANGCTVQAQIQAI